MDKNKNVDRVINMLYGICGCTNREALEVLMASVDRIIDKKKEKIQKSQRRFYFALSNGDFNEREDINLEEVKFELRLGSDWVLITKDKLSVYKVNKIMDIMKKKV